MIPELLLFAWKRVFAGSIAEFESFMAQNAPLNGRPYQNCLPAQDTVRVSRAKHCYLTLRNYESKDLANIKGDIFEHVDPFFGIFEEIGRIHCGILEDGSRIWKSR